MKTPPQFQPIDDNTNFIVFNIWLSCAFICGAICSYVFSVLAFVFAASTIVMLVVSNLKAIKQADTTNNP